jgi:hypothetical protein
MLKVSLISAKSIRSLFVYPLVFMGLYGTNASATIIGCDSAHSGCVILYESWNRDGVANNPPIYPVFTITKAWEIFQITDYHWNYGYGQNPNSVNGSISLYDNSSGALIGSWAAYSWNGNDTNWQVSPNVILNPGIYKIVDSDPGTWSYSTTDYNHLPGDGPNWQPYTGFSAVLAVPEPEEYAMMLLGFGMVGWQVKRKQRKAAPIAE